MNGRLARMCLAAWAVIGAVCASAEVPKAVDDKPVLAYQLDVSRGKIPTMQTLKRVVDLISELGYGQFQLYGENYFLYKGHEKVACRDAMTADEIRELDDYCAEKGIEFVPNQNSFGHMSPWLAQYPELAELPKEPPADLPKGQKAVKGPGTTLCPTDPRCLKLVDDLYEQLLPCFRSKLFNVGCDETKLHDVPYARSAKAIAEKGTARVYCDYLMKIHELVEKRGHRMMFWADIILHNPELVPELPENVIALDWGYEANHPFEKQTADLEKAKRDFYVCPGTSAWSSLAGRTDNMMANIDNAIAAGFRHGMKGVMLADWGDGGHPQPFLASVPALVFAAHRIKGEVLAFDRLADEIDRLLGCRVGHSLLRYGNLYKTCGALRRNGSELAQWLCQGKAYKRPKGMTDETLRATFAERAAARADRDLSNAPEWVRDDFETIDLLLDAVEACSRNEFGTIRSRFAPRYRELWLKQNRYSGLDGSVRRNLPE